MVVIDTEGLMPVVNESDLLAHLVYSATPPRCHAIGWAGSEWWKTGRHTVDLLSLRADVTASPKRGLPNEGTAAAAVGAGFMDDWLARRRVDRTCARGPTL